MAKILIIADTFPPHEGGSEAYLGVLARGLAVNNHDVSVYTPTSADASARCDEQMAQVRITRSVVWQRFQQWGGSKKSLLNRLARTLLLPFLLINLAPRRYDIIIAGHILPGGLVANTLRKFRRCQAVIVVTYGEEIAMYLRGRRMAGLVRKVIGEADAITCLTADSCVELDNEVPGTHKKCFVVPPAVPTIAGASPSNLSLPSMAGAPNLFTISRLVERKGIDTTIRAVALLVERFPEIHYTVAGAGPDRPRLEALIKELNLHKYVTLLGRIDDPDPYFRRCDIFCMVNRQLASGEREGFGIVFLEAGLRNKPSIAGRSGGAIDAVLDGKTGILVTPDNPAEMANAIVKLINDEPLRLRLGMAARAFAETFTEQRQVDAFETIIQKCLRS